jgi:hypothetical protein
MFFVGCCEKELLPVRQLNRSSIGMISLLKLAIKPEISIHVYTLTKDKLNPLSYSAPTRE